MPIAVVNESVARNKELSKSPHARRCKESTAANAQAVDIPVKKSAIVEKIIVPLSFRAMLCQTSIATTLPYYNHAELNFMASNDINLFMAFSLPLRVIAHGELQ